MLGIGKRSKVKNNRESLESLFVKADGGVERVALTKRGQLLVDTEARMAWGISNSHRRNYYGSVVQILTEESCAPQSIDGEALFTSDRLIRTVGESYDDEMYLARNVPIAQTWGRIFTTIALIFAVTVVVLIVAGLLQSGALSI